MNYDRSSVGLASSRVAFDENQVLIDMQDQFNKERELLHELQ